MSLSKWNELRKQMCRNRDFFWHSYMVCDMARGWNKRGKVELWMFYVNGKVNGFG